jgi:hypothetical protein
MVSLLLALFASRRTALWIPERRPYSIGFIIMGGIIGWVVFLIALVSDDAAWWQTLLVPLMGAALSASVFVLVLGINVALIDGPAAGFQSSVVRTIGVDRDERPLTPFMSLFVPIERLRERRG